MYDHIGLKVKDLEASVRFYTAALAALGYELCSHDAAGASFGPARRRRSGSPSPRARPVPACTWRSAPPTTRPSSAFTGGA